MRNVFSSLFEKNGIKDINDLSPEERATYENYEQILSAGEMTVDKVVKFCESQASIIETQFGNTDNSPEKTARLAYQHAIYKLIVKAITAPQEARKRLEEELQKKIKE